MTTFDIEPEPPAEMSLKRVRSEETLQREYARTHSEEYRAKQRERYHRRMQNPDYAEQERVRRRKERPDYNELTDNWVVQQYIEKFLAQRNGIQEYRPF
jgi:hypothetical protein